MVSCTAAYDMQICPESSIIKTNTGYISGINENGTREYLGIPYAAPPINELRWKPPEPSKPWKGILNADKFGPACPQISSRSGIENVGNMSEDCLYLNVWTPARDPEQKLPVMVFIHGGAFLRGSSSMYDGSALARKGVIIVTLNYRLGVLGFLAHPQLSEESPNNTSGNYGLLDQQMALRWVQENIAAFGGDPAKVTIFGESAGASGVLSHLVIPQSRGLYKQAIVESGPLWEEGVALTSFDARTKAEKNGVTFAENLGCSGPKAISQMRSVSAFDLVNATPGVDIFTFWGNRDVYFKPTIDGWLISEAPEDSFRKGRQNPVPLIIGTNADEGATLAAGTNMTVLAYEQYLRAYFGENTSQVLSKYPAKTSKEAQHQMERIMTDYDFNDAARLVAGSMAGLNQSTYLYRFTYVLPGQPNGAFHGSELPFVFRPGFWKPDHTSSNVSDYIMDFWVRFASTGDPNGRTNTTWPRYDPEKDQYLEMGTTPVIKNGY
jgi:para-nitrobenzyl esterase